MVNPTIGACCHIMSRSNFLQLKYCSLSDCVTLTGLLPELMLEHRSTCSVDFFWGGGGGGFFFKVKVAAHLSLSVVCNQ